MSDKGALPSDGPFAEARRKMAIAKEKLVQDSIKGRVSAGALVEKLNGFLEQGVINRAQYHQLFYTDPRRAAYEVQLIEKLAEQGLKCAERHDVFEEVELAGSRYFFENHSPLAALKRD